MRKLLIAFGAFALVGAACSDGDITDPNLPTTLPAATIDIADTTATSAAPSSTAPGPDVTSDPGVPRYKGDVVIVDHREPATLNPYLPGGQDPIVGIIGQAHLAGVYDIDPDTMQLIPELVTELPTVTNGGVILNADGSMDVTWNLHPDAEWSDGTAVTGRDLAFTLEYRAAASECTGFGTPPEPLPQMEVLATGDETLVARFAVASLDYELLFPWVLPSHEFDEGDDPCDKWNTTMGAAAGPFVFEAWSRDGEERSMRFRRNSNYWKTDESGDSLPYLDELQFVFVEDAAQAVEAFSARQADVISAPSSLENVPIDAWSGAGADVQVVPGLVWEHLNFQFGPADRSAANLNGLLEYRQAIAYAIDRRALLDDAGYPQLAVLNGFLTRFDVMASSQPWRQYQPDLDRARQLLAAACERAERDCTAEPIAVTYSSTANDQFRTAIADQIVPQLAEVGIKVELELEDSQVFFGDTLNNGTWDMGNWAWAGVPGSAGIVDFFSRLAPAEPPPNGANVYRWGTPDSSVAGDEAVVQFELLLERLRETVDADEIRDLARQAEELLAEQAVIIPLTARAVIGAVWSDEIQGFRMNPSSAGATWNIERWYQVGE